LVGKIITNLNKKKYGTSSFYFKPKEKLKEGAYVFNQFNRAVHVFNIDSKKMEEIGNSTAQSELNMRESAPPVGNNETQPEPKMGESTRNIKNEAPEKIINSLLNSIFKKK